MQPIVFDGKNSQSQPSPVMGFQPDIEISEIAYLENLPALGDLNEPLLGAAVNQIVSGGKSHTQPGLYSSGRMFKSSVELERFGIEMYLEKGFEINP
jgi:hypothetical protein